MIDWRLYYDLLVRLQESIDDHSYALHDSRYVTQPLPLGLPAVMAENPVLDGRPIVRRLDGVSQHRMLQTPAERIDDERRGLEVHVRYPERDEVRIAVTLPESIVFQGAAAAPVSLSVEIVFHDSPI